MTLRPRGSPLPPERTGPGNAVIARRMREARGPAALDGVHASGRDTPSATSGALLAPAAARTTSSADRPSPRRRRSSALRAQESQAVESSGDLVEILLGLGLDRMGVPPVGQFGQGGGVAQTGEEGLKVVAVPDD